jgi:hypothetical protein
MLQEAADAIEQIMGDGEGTDADAIGSSIGSNDEEEPEDDEGQEPEDGA